MPLLARVLILLLASLLFATTAQAAKKAPDLVVTRVVAPATAQPGATIKVDATTRNAGTKKSAGSTTRLWLAAGGRKVGLGQRAIAALGARKTSAGATAASVPVGTKPGAYELLACADDARKVKERNERNNCRAAKLTVQVAPAPAPAPAPQPTATPVPTQGIDLAAVFVADPPTAAREGASFGVADTVASRGTAAAGASTVRFYLSPDAEAGLKERRDSRDHPRTAVRDILMGGARDVPALGSGHTDASSRTVVTIPIGTHPGLYHLLACADDRGAVAEADEAANCVVAEHRIQVLAEEQPYRVDAFSDIFDQPSEASDIANLKSMSGLFCGVPVPGTITSLPQAIASIEATLTQKAPGAAAQFAAAPEYQDATKAEAAAGAAITTGYPGAALAALVRAHQLEPTEASHLVNAAAVASSVGLPSEALAMLDAARTLDDADRPAMGISRHAVALANRGQALAMLGRLPEADAALAGATAAEPLLTEADASRAATTVCREGAEPAARFLRAGRVRQPARPIDTSRGRETPLRNLEFPAFPKQAAETRSYYSGLSNQVLAEITAQNARADVLGARIRAKRDEWTRAQDRRYAGTLSLIYQANDEADIAALDRQVDTLLDKVIKTQRDFWGDNEREDHTYRVLADAASAWCAGSPIPNCFKQRMNETCRPKLKLAHQQWLDEIQTTYGAAQTLTRAASKRMSAYAAHLADPDAHALAMLQVTQYERAVFSRVLQWAQHWTHSAQLYSDHCVEPLAPPAPPAAPGAPEAASESCSGALKAMSGVFKLGPTELKVSCESISQSVKWDAAPWLQAYAEVTYDVRSGKLSVFGGSQGEISAGVAKGAFKSGVYVTVERNGTADVGWRVGPSASVGAGPVEFEVYKDEIDLSFVGAVSATFGL